MRVVDADIIRLTPELEGRVKEFMKEDATPQLISLVRGAIAAHEHAFHFPNVSKEAFLKLMSEAWDAGQRQQKLTSMEIIDCFLSSEFGEVFNKEDIAPQILNLVRGVTATYEYTFRFPSAPKEAFLKSMSEAWDAGEHQKKVYSMEIEGSINNGLGVALNLACYIALFGKRSGLLS